MCIVVLMGVYDRGVEACVDGCVKWGGEGVFMWVCMGYFMCVVSFIWVCMVVLMGVVNMGVYGCFDGCGQMGVYDLFNGRITFFSRLLWNG